MNKRNLRSFELHLSLIQLVLVLGIVTGSMSVAFYLGFGSGHTSGYEEASAANLVKAVKLPIADEELDGAVSDEQVSRVYAKLSEQGFQSPSAAGGRAGDGNVPELTSIPEAAPVKRKSLNDLIAAGERKAIENEAAEKETAEKETVAKELAEKKQALEFSKPEPLTTLAVTTALNEKPKELVASKNIVKKESITSDAVQILGDGGELFGGEIGGEKKKKRTLGGLLELSDQKPVTVPAESAVERAVKPPTPGVEVTPAVEKVIPTKVVQVDEPVSASPKVAEPTPKVVAKNLSQPLSGPLVSSKVRSGWYAQVAAPQKVQDARSLAIKLRNSGFPVSVEQADVRGQQYYRVLVGPETSRKLTNRLVEQLKREPGISGEPFVKKVK